ncbi:hypothetical protein ACIBHX_27970 [Nonomuraea sp. NPDC050536]|uniref:hypothetical protein n=1 Tax=Nonomuraea sp. NPDC050536 TaxID=3364366 RepID=UPI0037CA5C64
MSAVDAVRQGYGTPQERPITHADADELRDAAAVLEGRAGTTITRRSPGIAAACG